MRMICAILAVWIEVTDLNDLFLPQLHVGQKVKKTPLFSFAKLSTFVFLGQFCLSAKSGQTRDVVDCMICKKK